MSRKRKASRSTQAVVAERVEDVLKIRLLGGDITDIREYARGDDEEGRKPWNVSDGQLYRYIEQSDELLADRRAKDRGKLIALSLDKCRTIYARAMEAGDLRAAIAALKEENDLHGLYPAAKREVSGPGGGPIQLESKEVDELTDEQLMRIAARGLPDQPARGGKPNPAAEGGAQ